MIALDTVLILDFGGQYTHLIARRVRELGVYSEIVPGESSADEVLARRPGALVLSGGPRSVFDPDAPRPDPRILDAGLPILGICYGHQLISHIMGGAVHRSPRAEYGRTRIRVTGESTLMDGVPREFYAWMSHGDVVSRLPDGFSATAVSESGLIAAAESPRRRMYSVQFHPEVAHTEHGREILRNFLFRAAGLSGGWNPGSRIPAMVEYVAREVGPEGRALCAVSGGVDSMTAAVIAHRAIGDRLHVVFVDHGLLREGEVDGVLRALDGVGIRNVHFVDASDRFLSALSGVVDPEEKRLIIGRLFAEVFEEVASGISGIGYLVQGTIYPDRIESGASGRGSDRIKSHHNVAGLPEKFGLRVVEPLRDLYKDEVRTVARELGLPESVVGRHPFPGPGLAVRIEGEVTREKLAIARRANAIVEEEFVRAGLYGAVWQAFAAVMDSTWVGVKGDRRELGRVVIVRAVTSEDGMTADWFRIPHDLLAKISKRISEEVSGVVMVAYAATSKPPSTIEPC
ncbi:MAG: glutamine-hydrolyzing GMP synthase [Conexivisphaerales archaeon]|nr:glutamine-hydrolyzing GMP synthase [Conexivisphaerales archaeon]